MRESGHLLLDSAQEIAHLGSVEVDIRTGETAWSDEYFRLLGYQPGEVQPSFSRFLERLHPDYREDAILTVEAIRNGETRSVEYPVILPDGTHRWLQIQGGLIPIGEGQEKKFVATALDITIRKNAEQTLQKQIERQKLLLECSRMLLESQESEVELIRRIFESIQCHLNADTCFYYMMDAQQQVLRLKVGIGIPESRKFEAAVLQMGQAFCGTVAAQASPLLADTQRIFSDAKGAFVRSLGLNAYTCHPLISSRGEIMGTFSVASKDRDYFSLDEDSFLHTLCHLIGNAVERRRTEVALRQSEARFRNTFNQAAVGMAHLDSEGNYLRVNQRLCDIVGYTADELLSHKLQEIVHPDDIAQLTAAHEQMRAGVIKNIVYEQRLLHKEGAVIWANLTATLIQSTPESLPYFVYVIENITERKRAEAERRYILESAGCLLWSSDVVMVDGKLEWTLLYFDEEAAQRLVPVEAPPGIEYIWKWHGVRFPEDRQRNYQYADGEVRAGRSYADEFRMRATDGSVYWLREDVRVETLEPGKHWHLVGVCTNITPVKKAQEVVMSLQQYNEALEERVRERTVELEQAQERILCYAEEVESAHTETLERLARVIEFRDDHTGEHTLRVGRTAGLIAEKLGFPPDKVRWIGQAGRLHDIGKVGISDVTLLKPGRLTEEEFAVVKTHAVIGAGLFAGGQSEMMQIAQRIAASHHEWWDGTGYPLGLSGEAIPIEARIIAVADVFDALTHDRPYKKAWSLPDALDEIQRLSGQQFDPLVVNAFLALPHDTLI